MYKISTLFSPSPGENHVRVYVTKFGQALTRYSILDLHLLLTY